ncbi:hypothetical protein AAFF_G00105820 [Aldrovandia affinis]|uniref:Myb/SANT-like DNA-binding domain-containing protein n=1 Tax=Aldrovandia affinis TaxID=143900 RepID=A0AAD7T274_9TELE|nr:hypothetical protein AAFF_G00105820 [Aldrovandia affinis]
MDKKKRGPKWTAEEKAILLKEYASRRPILESRVHSDLTKLAKLKHWEEIAACINALNPMVSRSIYDIKKKMFNISYTARNDARFKHTFRKRAPAPPVAPAPTQIAVVSFLPSPTACPQEMASTPATLQHSYPQQAPLDPPAQAPQPPVSPFPESSRTYDEPQEQEGQGREFDRLHTAITDCGDRIVAALEPIADSFQQLTHQVGLLVEVLAKRAQVRSPCSHACPTCECLQGQPYSEESVRQLKSEVDQFSWET